MVFVEGDSKGGGVALTKLGNAWWYGADGL